MNKQSIYSNRLPEGSSIQPESVMALMRQAMNPENVQAYREPRAIIPAWLFIALRTEDRRRIASYGTQ